MSATATATVDTSAVDRLRVRLGRIADPDATPLMATYMRIIDDDNRKGVLAGTDMHGNPMAPVTYRPKSKDAKPVRLTVEQRLGQNAGLKRGRYVGLGPKTAANNNLTSAEYRLLSGPPLAPRGQFSRVITNLLTDYDDSQRLRGQWEAWGYWDEVVSVKGVSFLKYHFDGTKRLPQRDLRGLRPAGMILARTATRNWAMDIVRTYSA
jgi:hypothetical protein